MKLLIDKLPQAENTRDRTEKMTKQLYTVYVEL